MNLFPRRNPQLETFQKLPPEVFYKKTCSSKICNVHKKRLQQRCFPENIAKFLKTSISKNIYEQLLLTFQLPKVQIGYPPSYQTVFHPFGCSKQVYMAHCNHLSRTDQSENYYQALFLILSEHQLCQNVYFMSSLISIMFHNHNFWKPEDAFFGGAEWECRMHFTTKFS